MARPKNPLKAWLMLSLAVLLLHLALLQTLPFSVSSSASEVQPLTFATRTVLPEPAAAVVPRPPVAARPAPRQLPRVTPAAPPKAVPEPAPEPEPPALVPPSSAVDAQPSEPAQAPQEAASVAVAQADPAPHAPREPAAPLNPVSLPGSVKLIYQGQTNKFPLNLTGFNGELLWQQDGQRYQARLSFGVLNKTRTQTSRGLLGSDGLAPERFSDKFNSEVAAHFNREQGKVTFSTNTPDAPLLTGAQDRLSVLIQLAGMVAGTPDHFAMGTTVTIQTVGPRDADTWLFTVGDMETLELPGGVQQALKLTRNPRQPYDQQLEVWLAPGLGYLPARIRLTEANGDYVDLTWQASEAAPAP